jgi:hypothetical protein
MRTVRVVAVLLWAASLAAWSQGVSRWGIKTSVPAGTNFSRPAKVDIADLLALPNVEGVTRNDKRFKATRIPAKPGDKFPEGKQVTTTGWLHLVGREDDGDYHIQISASDTSGDQCLVVETPNPEERFTATAELRPKFAAVRDFIKEKLLAGKDPSTKGSVMTHPVFVRVTGILFYDDPHVGTEPRGMKGMKAATLWELHPVTAIAFVPKPR